MKRRAAAERPPATEEWIVSHARFIALAFIVALIGTVYLARHHRRMASRPPSTAPSRAMEPTIELPSGVPVEAAGGSAVPTAPAASAAQSVLRPAETAPAAAPATAATELGAPAGAVLGPPRTAGGLASVNVTSSSTAPAMDPLFVFPPSRSTAATDPRSTKETLPSRGASSPGVASAAVTSGGSPAAAVEAPRASPPSGPVGYGEKSQAASGGRVPAADVPPMPTHYPGSVRGAVSTTTPSTPAPAGGIVNPYVNASVAGQSGIATGNGSPGPGTSAGGSGSVSYPVTAPAGTYASAAGAYGVLPAGGAVSPDPVGNRQAGPSWSTSPQMSAASGAGSWTPPTSYPTTATREPRHERIGSGNY